METEKRLEFERLIGSIESLEDFREADAIFGERWRTLGARRDSECRSLFSIGDRVSLLTRDGDRVFGQIMKKNSRTATLFMEDSGHRWRVSFSALTKEPGATEVFSSEKDRSGSDIATIGDRWSSVMDVLAISLGGTSKAAAEEEARLRLIRQARPS